MRINIQLEGSKEIFSALLDTGCSKSLISKKLWKVNRSLGGRRNKSSTKYEQIKGNVDSYGSTSVRFRLPQLQSNLIIDYDFEIIKETSDVMLIGRDLGQALGLIINMEQGTVQWGDSIIRIDVGKDSKSRVKVEDIAELKISEETFEKGTRPEDLIPDHLPKEDKKRLLEFLQHFHHLYNGRLGKMKFPPYKLPIDPKFDKKYTKPVPPYPIPVSQIDQAKKEVEKLIALGVLEQVYESDVVSPAFFILKPSGSLRLLIDFRFLNKHLIRSPYFVPRIKEILLKLGKAKFFSTLDANMGYYGRALDKSSRGFTAFSLPFGKFRYKRLPMGISTAPDEYQACMEQILGDLPFVIIYLDDILIFSETKEDHFQHIQIVFERLEEHDVTLQGLKCFLFRLSVDYLGFTLTSNGLQPQAKKIDAIQRIATPKNKKQLRQFLGMINYYREMIPNKTMIANPLNKLTSKKEPFVWTTAANKVFQQLKTSFAQAVLLSFPDFTKPFNIYAEAANKLVVSLLKITKSLLATANPCLLLNEIIRLPTWNCYPLWNF